MLTELEDAFRTIKSELELRPIHHQKERRSEAHIFIAVLAYHVLHSIRTKLKTVGLNYRWTTIRKLLSTHARLTTCVKTQSGQTIYIRKCSEPESFHRTIYEALNLDLVPCKAKKWPSQKIRSDHCCFFKDHRLPIERLRHAKAHRG